MKTETLTRWTVDKSEELYGVRNWGAGYFSIARNGDVLVRPFGERNPVEISMMEIVAGLKDRGLAMPVLIRFGKSCRDPGSHFDSPQDYTSVTQRYRLLI